MRLPILLILFCVFHACGVRNASEIKDEPAALSTETPYPTPEDDYLHVQKINLKPLNQAQERELDSTLPPEVREILEKAEALEVLGLSSEDKAGIGWYPDVKASLPVGPERNELLRSFFFDASAGPNASACFIPRHGLRATYKGRSVEVIICFQCHLFAVDGDLGKHSGGVYRDGSASHHLFEKVLESRRSQP